MDQGRRVDGLGLVLDFAPHLEQDIVIAGELLLGPVHPGGADDETHPLLGRDLLHELHQALARLVVVDLAGNPRALAVRHQDDVAAGKRDEGREHGALVVLFVPGDLHDDLLTVSQVRPSPVPVAFLVGLLVCAEVLGAHVVQGQKPVLLGAVVHEGRLEAPLDLEDDPLVDVARDRLPGRHLDVVLHELAALQDGHPAQLLVHGVDEHDLFHESFPRCPPPG